MNPITELFVPDDEKSVVKLNIADLPELVISIYSPPIASILSLSP